MKVLKQILKYLAYTFLSCLVALCVYTFVMTELLKKDYVNIFGYTYFVVATGSMSGTIEVNDVVIVKLTNNYIEDDIITYMNEGSFITHRVISMNENQVITKGDVNNVEDDPIDRTSVIGKVSFVFSLSFIFKLLGIGIILFIFLTLINFEKIFKKYIIKENKKPENNPLLPSLDDFKMICLADEEEAKLLNVILRMIQLKNNNVKNIVEDDDSILKFQYLYKLLNIILVGNETELYGSIDRPPFKELYNYSFESIGLDDVIASKLYDMHIYGFLKILVFATLYEDKEFFDGVYKIFKYKVKIDKCQKFITIDRTNVKQIIEIENLLNFMRQISFQIPNNELLELDKIAEFVRLKKNINGEI